MDLTIRELITGLHKRLDGQDRALGEIKRDLRDVKAEVKLTNGRVTDLETKEAVSLALGERAEDERKDLQQTKADRAERFSNFWAVVAGATISFVLLVIGHHFHML